jgi:hypothetical protein
MIFELLPSRVMRYGGNKLTALSPVGETSVYKLLT